MEQFVQFYEIKEWNFSLFMYLLPKGSTWRVSVQSLLEMFVIDFATECKMYVYLQPTHHYNVINATSYGLPMQVGLLWIVWWAEC